MYPLIGIYVLKVCPYLLKVDYLFIHSGCICTQYLLCSIVLLNTRIWIFICTLHDISQKAFPAKPIHDRNIWNVQVDLPGFAKGTCHMKCGWCFGNKFILRFLVSPIAEHSYANVRWASTSSPCSSVGSPTTPHSTQVVRSDLNTLRTAFVSYRTSSQKKMREFEQKIQEQDRRMTQLAHANTLLQAQVTSLSRQMTSCRTPSVRRRSFTPQRGFYSPRILPVTKRKLRGEKITTGSSEKKRRKSEAIGDDERNCSGDSGAICGEKANEEEEESFEVEVERGGGGVELLQPRRRLTAKRNLNEFFCGASTSKSHPPPFPDV